MSKTSNNLEHEENVRLRKSNIRFVFFGTGEIARHACDELERAGVLPALVITAPDAPKGRGKKLEPSHIARWAEERNIPTLKPKRVQDAVEELRKEAWDLFIVIDYGLFLPREVLDMPKHGALNMHPSLLPRLRGASPIRSAILNDEKTTGVSVILLDEELDHGPIVAQKPVEIPEWPPKGSTLDELLAREGAKLLLQILPQWLAGDIEPQEQNHDIATYCEKFSKEDGLLDLSDDVYKNFLKIRAFEGWPGTYAFFERNGKRLRVQILDAHLEGGKLILDRVKPEGKKEMSYEEFVRSGARPA